MAVYGIIIKDADGNAVKITPDVANVISVGQVTMPAALVDTDKYYASVDLPGTSALPIDNICCIMNAFLLSVNIYAVAVGPTATNGYYDCYFHANDAVTNYTKNLATGVMTTWVPGDTSNVDDINDWDPILALYPDIYWDKFSDTTVTAVKIFASMRYHVHDGSADAIVDAYQLTSVEKVDYAICMRRVV